VKDDHVLDARPKGVPVARRRRELRRLDGIDGGSSERIRSVPGRSSGFNSGLDVPVRGDHELQDDLRLEGGDVGRKRGDDGRKWLGLNHLSRRLSCYQEDSNKNGTVCQADSPPRLAALRGDQHEASRGITSKSTA
jgi:hypothetical protein